MAGSEEPGPAGPTLEALVAEEVLRARKAAGLSQRALAERAGVTQAMVSRLESGARLPRLDTLLALAEATDCVLEIRLKRPRGGRPAGLRGRTSGWDD
jgi:transcriptional regulator with XRE-family HTH domain